MIHKVSSLLASVFPRILRTVLTAIVALSLSLPPTALGGSALKEQPLGGAESRTRKAKNLLAQRLGEQGGRRERARPFRKLREKLEAARANREARRAKRQANREARSAKRQANREARRAGSRSGKDVPVEAVASGVAGAGGADSGSTEAEETTYAEAAVAAASEAPEKIAKAVTPSATECNPAPSTALQSASPKLQCNVGINKPDSLLGLEKWLEAEKSKISNSDDRDARLMNRRLTVLAQRAGEFLALAKSPSKTADPLDDSLSETAREDLVSYFFSEGSQKTPQSVAGEALKSIFPETTQGGRWSEQETVDRCGTPNNHRSGPALETMRAWYESFDAQGPALTSSNSDDLQKKRDALLGQFLVYCPRLTFEIASIKEMVVNLAPICQQEIETFLGVQPSASNTPPPATPTALPTIAKSSQSSANFGEITKLTDGGFQRTVTVSSNGIAHTYVVVYKATGVADAVFKQFAGPPGLVGGGINPEPLTIGATPASAASGIITRPLTPAEMRP